MFVSPHKSLRAIKLSPLSIALRNPSVGFRNFYVFPKLRSKLGVVSSSLSSETVELNWERRRGVSLKQKSIALPFWHQPSSNYSRIAYQDYSSDESDVELGSSQQQLVSIITFRFAFFFGKNNNNKNTHTRHACYFLNS